jgi:hypothetical protein
MDSSESFARRAARRPEVSPKQRELARHALGLPNRTKTSYRNHFCIGAGNPDHAEWEKMVEAGEAVKRSGPNWGGDDMFHLTLEGALKAREPKEHLSREDAAMMRQLQAQPSGGPK